MGVCTDDAGDDDAGVQVAKVLEEGQDVGVASKLDAEAELDEHYTKTSDADYTFTVTFPKHTTRRAVIEGIHHQATLLQKQVQGFIGHVVVLWVLHLGCT